MKTSEEDQPYRMPQVSGPAPRREGTLSPPMPKIKGYEIVRELGEAGQGRVWRAVQLSTHRQVALKVPRVDLLRSRKALARFEREVERIKACTTTRWS
jgi:serine/threonine protein kinase